MMGVQSVHPYGLLERGVNDGRTERAPIWAIQAYTAHPLPAIWLGMVYRGFSPYFTGHIAYTVHPYTLI